MQGWEKKRNGRQAQYASHPPPTWLFLFSTAIIYLQNMSKLNVPSRSRLRSLLQITLNFANTFQHPRPLRCYILHTNISAAHSRLLTINLQGSRDVVYRLQTSEFERSRRLQVRLQTANFGIFLRCARPLSLRNTWKYKRTKAERC